MTSLQRRWAGRGGYVSVLIAIVASGAFLLWMGRQQWVPEGDAQSGLLPVNTLATFVGAFTLASGVAVIALRALGRRIVGALIVVGGLAVFVMSLAAIPTPGITISWVLAAVAASVIVGACGVAVVMFAGQWPGMSGRYERTGEPSAWAQLDAGEDPTLSRP